MVENTYYSPGSGAARPKLVRIQVEKLRLRAYIGFKKWETEKLQDLIINYTFRYNAAGAIQSDAEADVLDYKAITKSIIGHVDRQSFHLLERVAEDILDIIRKNPYTRDIVVRVEKPHALRFSENVWVEVEGNERPNEAVISLGSNIDPEMNTARALERLAETGSILQKTNLIYTEPEKIKDQDQFLNGAVLLETDLPFEELRARLKAIENDLGRDRSGPKNGPRNIDLDIILFNGTVTDDEVYEYGFLQRFLKELKSGVVI